MFREAVRVTGGVEGVVREPARRLVVLAAAGSGRGQRQHHVRPERPDHADHLAERLLLAPLLEGLLDAERVAEVGHHPEVLLHRVESVRGQEFFGSQDPQPVKELGADLVLAAPAAGQAQQRDPRSHPAAEQGVKGVVLVVGVSNDREHRNPAADLAERESEPGGAPILGGGAKLGRRGSRAPARRDRQGESEERSPAHPSWSGPWSCHHSATSAWAEGPAS